MVSNGPPEKKIIKLVDTTINIQSLVVVARIDKTRHQIYDSIVNSGSPFDDQYDVQFFLANANLTHKLVKAN